MTFWSELKRRQVVKVAVAYVVVGLGVLGAAELILDPLGLEGARPLIVVLTLLGFPLAIVLAWAYDVTPEGIKRASPNEGGSSAVGTALEGAPKDQSAAKPADRRRIAVLPFSSFSAGEDDEYFADGVTEELTSVISRVSGLEVIARTSVMPYKTAPQPVSVIARDLSVGTVLEGSIRRAGNRVRVTVQLIDAATEAHLWSEDYDRELSDIFAIQTSIARAVAEELRVTLLAGEQERIDKPSTQDLEAHDLYLLGRHQLLKRNHDSLLRAIDFFERALAKDSSYALASAGLGEAWAWASIGYVMDPPADAAPRARAAAEEAVRFDGDLAEAHVALGMVSNLQYDLETAWSALQRAIELNPSSAPAYQALAFYWIMRGDFDEQLRHIERAMELDPRSASIRTEAGWPHAYEWRYELFLQRAREALELDPDYALAHFNVGNALDALGDGREAIASYERALELDGPWGWTKGFMVRALVKLGREEAAREVLAELLERGEREAGLCLALAIAYDGLGDAENALLWIERGQERGEDTAYWLHVDGFLPFEATRGHPHFQTLKEKLNQRIGRV